MRRRRPQAILTTEGMVDTHQFLGPRPRRLELVYYVRRDGLIKIGYTTNLRLRMKNLRPDELLAIEYGTRALETQRHHQFVAFRAGIGREWFEPATELLEHIDERRSALPPPPLGLLVQPHSLDVLVDRYGHELRPPNVLGGRAGGQNCKACFSTAMAVTSRRGRERQKPRLDPEEYRARKYAEIMSSVTSAVRSTGQSEDVAS